MLKFANHSVAPTSVGCIGQCGCMGVWVYGCMGVVLTPTHPYTHTPIQVLTCRSVFLDTGFLADYVAEVVQFGAADFSAPGYFDPIHARRMDQEGPLHADAVGDLPNRKVLPVQRASHRDDDAFKHLDALFAPFHDFGVYLDGIARPEFRYVALELFALDFRNDRVQ